MLYIFEMANNHMGSVDHAKRIVDEFADLAQKKLRHVSEAFKEDPLRVLRVCRFKAKLPEFTIAQETFELMQGMIHSNDFATLSKHHVAICTTELNLDPPHT